MKALFVGTILAFIGICGVNYLCGCIGLSIHNQLVSNALSAFAGCGALSLAARF